MRCPYDVFRVRESDGLRTLLFSHHNEWVNSWGAVVAQCLGKGDASYALRALYVEFQNVASSGDAVSIPDIDGIGLDYYNELSSSPNRDFLRLPLDVDPTLRVVAGYEDFIPEGLGNQLQFFGTTSGDAGVHGKEFSEDANSKICGIAIAAAPVWGDRTRDVLFARSYYPEGNQALKEDGSQHAVSYTLPLVLST